MATDTISPLLAQGFADCATALDGFGPAGEAMTADDVAAIYERWTAIPEEERHMVALCFMQFDSNREVFGAVLPSPT